MDRTQKEAFVAELNGVLQSMETVVVADYRGTTVAEMEALRGSMAEEGGNVKVAKNRLAKIAFKGTNFESLSDLMQGPTVLSFSDDPVAAAKVAQKFADQHKSFEILGGAMGEKFLDQAGVKALASMPSLDELRGKLVGLLVAPATKIATVTQEPAAKTARVLSMKPAA